MRFLDYRWNGDGARFVAAFGTLMPPHFFRRIHEPRNGYNSGRVILLGIFCLLVESQLPD